MIDHIVSIAEESEGREPDCTECESCMCFDAPSGSNFKDIWSADGGHFVDIHFGERTKECRKKCRQSVQETVS